MKLAIVLGSVGVALSTACASTVDRERMHQEFQSGSPGFSSRTVKEVEAITSQLTVPFELAVAPPVWRSERTWSHEERAEIESWGPELAKLGLVDKLVILTEAECEISPGGETYVGFDRLRVAAARHHADALLVIRDIDQTSEWMNGFSILDLTIIGAWLVPGHSAESASMMEGLVIDNRNEYLFCSGHGEGSAKVTAPLVYVEPAQVRRQARVAALKELKVDMLEQAQTAVAESARPGSP